MQYMRKSDSGKRRIQGVRLGEVKGVGAPEPPCPYEGPDVLGLTERPLCAA